MHPNASRSDANHRLTRLNCRGFEGRGELSKPATRPLLGRISVENGWSRVPFYAIVLLLMATAIAKLWIARRAGGNFNDSPRREADDDGRCGRRWAMRTIFALPRCGLSFGFEQVVEALFQIIL
jgi:hypothetical protein